MTVNIGDKAPDFDLPTYSDTRLSLKDLKGKNVVLYFYPKDILMNLDYPIIVTPLQKAT